MVGHDSSATEALSELMFRYVSIGEGCCFGVVQRYCRIEPMDLFRFANMSLSSLIGQLDSRLESFRGLARLTVTPDRTGREFFVREPTAGISLHTGQRVGTCTAEQAMEREFRRIPRLARKLLQELETGERIALYCQRTINDDEISALRAAIARHGPTRLLVVTETQDPKLVGGVVKYSDSALVGYVDRIGLTDWARYPSFDAWLAVVRTAERMFADPSIPSGTTMYPRTEDFGIPSGVGWPFLWRALAARRLGDIGLARALFAEHRRECPNPGDWGCEFDSELLAPG